MNADAFIAHAVLSGWQLGKVFDNVWVIYPSVEPRPGSIDRLRYGKPGGVGSKKWYLQTRVAQAQRRYDPVSWQHAPRGLIEEISPQLIHHFTLALQQRT